MNDKEAVKMTQVNGEPRTCNQSVNNFGVSSDQAAASAFPMHQLNSSGGHQHQQYFRDQHVPLFEPRPLMRPPIFHPQSFLPCAPNDINMTGRPNMQQWDQSAKKR